MRIVVDRTKCAGMGICEGIDPQRFEIQGDGKTRVRQEHLEDDEELEVAREAVAMCPTESLEIAD